MQLRREHVNYTNIECFHIICYLTQLKQRQMYLRLPRDLQLAVYENYDGKLGFKLDFYFLTDASLFLELFGGEKRQEESTYLPDVTINCENMQYLLKLVLLSNC